VTVSGGKMSDLSVFVKRKYWSLCYGSKEIVLRFYGTECDKDDFRSRIWQVSSHSNKC